MLNFDLNLCFKSSNKIKNEWSSNVHLNVQSRSAQLATVLPEGSKKKLPNFGKNNYVCLVKSHSQNAVANTGELSLLPL